MSNQPHVEFLVEPFEEGKPGRHVTAAVAAFEQNGLSVDLGPFSSTSSGTIDDIANAVAEMIRSSMNAGASALRIQVGADHSDLDGVGSLKNALTDLVRAAERELGTEVGNWDRVQKQAAVRMLHERGCVSAPGRS